MTPIKSVAVITNALYHYQNTVIAGVQSVLQALQIPVTVYVGQNINSPEPVYRRANDMYDLMDPEKHLGVILLSGALGVHLSDEALEEWVQRFEGVPVVSIGRKVRGVPSILINNRPAMQDMMQHLLEVRGFRKMVFMRGIVGNRDSEEREAVFREGMQAHGLPIQEALVLTGQYASSRAHQEMTRLLSRTRDFEAVVCANDEMAEGVIQAITQLGLRVPEDIAVVGFDDSEEFKHVVPALTTVRQPFFEQGEEAARVLLALSGASHKEDHFVLPQLVVRESCGPALPTLATQVQSRLYQGVLDLQQHLSEVFQQVAPHPEQHARFLNLWKETLLTRNHLEQEFYVWRDGVQSWMNLLDTPEQPCQGLVLGYQAQTLLVNVLQMMHSRHHLLSNHSSKMAPELYAVEHQEDLFQTMEAYLDHVGIKHHMVVLYAQSGPRPDPLARVVLASGVRSVLDPSLFQSRKLLPDSMQSELASGTLYCSPLYVNEVHYGFLLYEPPMWGRFDDEALCRTLSHALQQLEHVLVLRGHAEELEMQVQLRTRELKSEVAERRKAEEALKLANAELQRFAFLDGLTGIYNRAAFNEHLQSQWAIHRRHRRPLSLLLCDVDFFKRYNDFYGHLKGDDCLRDIAAALSGAVRNRADTVARYGGEEFVVILPETGTDGAALVAERIQDAVRRLGLPHEGSESTDTVTVSVGVATVYPHEWLHAADLIQMADQCLYQAKQRGRDCMVQHPLEQGSSRHPQG